MSFTYTVTTDVGRVRLLIMDTNALRYVFEDDEIAVFLALEGGVKRAAALALETIASNEAFVQKVITILDLQTDGAKTSDALLKRAAVLRDQAATEDAAASGGAFDIAEWAVSDFAARDLALNAALRGGY